MDHLPTFPGSLLPMAAVLAIAVTAGSASAAGFDADRPMDEGTARAMLGRFGYGPTPASLELAMQQTPRQYLRHAIDTGSRLPPQVASEIASLPVAEPLASIWNRLGPGGSAREGRRDEDGKKALQREENQYAGAAVQARLLAMANGDNPGHEALLSFWLNHFSIFAPKNLDKLLAWDYARALEDAMGADSFEALLRASFYHPAMQVYLDNARSTAPSSLAAERAAEQGRSLGINENLARELLELHTLGVDGGYTQKDVQELARIITGAGVRAPRMDERALARAGATSVGLFLFDPRRHDVDAKTFLGQSFPTGRGMDEIDRALHLMANHPATARHVARKLAERFLADDPPLQVVEAMAAGFRRSSGRISATLMPLLESPAFAASLSQPAKFKEPLDFVISAARAACGDTPVGNRLALAAAAMDQGQAPFMHTTPDGYGSRESDWLSPAAMAKRARLAMGIAGERIPLAAGDDDRVGRLRALSEAGRAPGRGTVCLVDALLVERLAGPPGPTTASAAAGLQPRERAALLLSSPEFMRR